MKKLLLFQKLIYVSSATRKEVIWQHHNNTLAKHFEIDKTMKLISQNYYFLLMWQKVKKYIQQCKQCQKSKSKKHKSYEKLQSLNVSDKSWQSITVNFIIKLSKFRKLTTEFKYDSVIIIVNKFTKRAYFISFHKKMSTEKVAYLFKWYIIANHEVLTKIIFNKNIWFRSKFW